jgi:predicted deacylase
MKNSNLTICDVTIQPGEVANLALPLPEFYSCASFYMPIKIVHGKEAGPCLLIFSAVKGDQLNGLEIINRLLESPQLRHIRGTLIAVPVLNVFGLVAPSRTLSSESRFERCFPGSVDGSFGDRLAYLFTQEILCKANHCIELQTGSLNHDILPQVYCNLNDASAKKLAKSFAAPVITNVVTENHSLRQTAEQLNIPLLVYQAGEAMRFNEAAISLGLSGILNVMQTLEMIPKQEETSGDTPFKPIFSQDQDWIRAHSSGVLLSDVELGQMIKQGQCIGRIKDPFSADTAERITAPHDGVVVGINRHPLIHEGQTIINVASFIDNDRAESALEAWGDAQVDE